MRELRAKTLGVTLPEPKFVPPPKPRRGKKTRLPEKELRTAAKVGLTDEQVKKILRQRTEF